MMHRAIVIACLPWLALLVLSGLCVVFLVRLSSASLRLGQLRQLHGDVAGSVQSLSFVLTLPLFVMFMLFIVQISQILIGTMVVNYAAFAAARAAIVWIPADLAEGPERSNCISSIFSATGDADDAGGAVYEIAPGSPKFQKIQLAAALACVPIAPSRDLGLARANARNASAETIKSVYRSLAPDSQSSVGIPRRLESKLAYSLANTEVRVSFYHKPDEPPIARYDLADDPNEFYDNEVGWQDPITVTVTHHFALLPGPGRLLGKPSPGPGGSRDGASERIRFSNRVYVYPIRASATLGNEGEKSVLPYVYQDY